MPKITKAVAKAFSRLRDANTNRAALQGAFPDPSGHLCACDGFMLARLYNAASAPELADIPRPAADPLHARLLDMLTQAAQSDAVLQASAARADYHGSKPILTAQQLRAFSRWSARTHGDDAFPVGGSFVSAGRLALLLDILPDACIYVQSSPVQPLYLSGADGDAMLLPIRCNDPDGTRARLAEYERQQQISASTPAPISAPPADFVPVSIREAVEHTPETPLKVIGYKSDGNTVCIHRVKAHHVADNVYVYAGKPGNYGLFAWRFVSVFACGYALELDCVQDIAGMEENPDSVCNKTSFHCRSFVGFLREINTRFADESAFIAHIETLMQSGQHVKLSFVRILQEMGNHAELISRVMEHRHNRARAQEEEAKQRERARLEQEQQEEEQRQQEHAQALAACQETLLRDGERMPIDGAVLCELAASLGVPVSLKLKGWIVNKLATITIENGHMVTYQYNRHKKTEKGSNAFWPFMQALMEALQAQTQEQPEEANAEELAHLFGCDNTPKAENQAANLETEAYKRLMALSSGTVSTLMREKGLQNCEKYAAIDAFHHAIILAAQTLTPVEDETWQQLFERAYAVLYSATQQEEQEQPINQTDANNTQKNTQGSTQEASSQHAPALEKQPQNPSCDGHTLPETWTHAEQITMRMLLNTS